MLQISICARTPAGNYRGFIHPGTWADEARVERLKMLWADGRSASEIAALLGEVSRNAVIGKAYRLGLPPRRTVSRQPRQPSSHRNRTGRISMRKPVPRSRPLPTAPAPLPPAPPALMISVAQLKDTTCHWPIGDPRKEGFGFCGAKTAAGRQPYCAHHQAIGHNRGCV
jgi:GcrA cell cycle regulator